LHKKLAATLTIAIFLFSTLAILAPVQAHFTLGDNLPNYPYHTNDFDPHVPGVIGYVWPGGGENTYLGYPTQVTNVVSPGYVSPYPVQSLTGAGVYPSPWTQNYAQLDGHEYAPFGAIVTGTTGDLIFAVNSTEIEGNFTALYIAIPPEFTVPGVEQVVTTITNNYANILKYKANMFDRYVPGWTIIRIIADPQHNIWFDDGGPGQWYYVRINGVTAPSVAGKYFFKMYFTASTGGGVFHDGNNYWVPTENWPVLLVKGELDPAIITGTIRYGGYDPALYGNPIEQAGMVWAKMTSKFDPYTGATLGTCPDHTSPTDAFDHSTGCYDAWGFFNSTAMGHFEVEGVAPGVYDLYAEAAGYPLDLIASGVQVLKGQSLHFDGYLNPGPVIHGNVFSKHAFGAEPWPYPMYIKIELYDSPTLNHVPNASAGTPVSWSPLPCVAGGQDDYYPGNDAAACGDPRQADMIAFPWQDYTGGTGGVFAGGADSTDPQGVGPLQNWYVVADGTNDIFHYEFGAKGMFGAPRDLDGHVPQLYSTWVNGLTAGRYYVRAWVFRYVQSALDGSTFQEYSFEVTPKEWAGDISLPLDLRISSWVNKTVHFHNNAGTIQVSTINTGAGWVYGKLVNTADSVMYSYNTTKLTSTMKQNGESYVTFYGLNDTWLGQNYGIPAGTYKPMVAALGYLQQTQDLVSVTLSGTPILISNHLYRGAGFNFTVYSIDWERPRVNRNWVWNATDIGIGIFTEPGHVFLSEADDYIDGSDALATATLQNSSTYFVEVEGKGVNINSNDGAQGAFFGIEGSHPSRIGGSISNTGSAFTTSSAKNAWKATFYWPTAFDSGMYSFQGWTYGYIQDKDFSVYVNKGQVADIKINLIIGVNITVDILFKKEHLISGTPYDMAARVRVFDDSGMLVATWMSSEGVYLTAPGRATAAYGVQTSDSYDFDGGYNFLPAGTNLLHVQMAGLPLGYGDPVFTPGSGDFELDQWPFDYWSVAGAHFPNEGVLGQPDYTGTGWTVEVDFVNWYYGAVSPLSENTRYAVWHTWYPVVPGLLMGESYHIIPGTQATSGISYTEDGALNDYFLGHSMAPNHLGPYSQQGVWSLGTAHLSGEVSGEWEVDLNGYVSGTALAFTWSNELRTLSWYTVSVTGAEGMAGSPFMAYTYDGLYEFYLTPGTYAMTLSGPGYAPTSMGTIAVTDGQSGIPGSGNNIGLPPSNIPVPEFSGLAIVAFSALAASLYLLRRKRQ
jgi:hypothetical protein